MSGVASTHMTRWRDVMAAQGKHEVLVRSVLVLVLGWVFVKTFSRPARKVKHSMIPHVSHDSGRFRQCNPT